MMHRSPLRHWAAKPVSALCLMLWMTLIFSAAYAQTNRTIEIRMLDSKTGKTIASSEFQVWINHAVGTNRQWVQPNKEGVGEMALPPNASVIAVHAQYGQAKFFYVNCDSIRDGGLHTDHWYPVAEILSSGIVAPNGCNKRIVIAKPGEFVFFVRPQHWWEEMRQ